MSFDASAPSSESPPDIRRRRQGAGPLSLGVFNHDGAWKIYSAFERAAAYPDRGMAVQAAQSRAAAAARCGQRVELFIEDEDGALRQAALEPPAAPPRPAIY